MITESKLKSGVLTFDPDGAGAGTPLDFSCQPTNVRITPNHDEDGDPLETLCGDTLGADETRTDTLSITAVQDFTDAAGFQRFSWENDGTVMPFTWTPNADGPTFSGQVKVRAVEVGGDVNKRLTVDIEWPCIGTVTWTPAA